MTDTATLPQKTWCLMHQKTHSPSACAVRLLQDALATEPPQYSDAIEKLVLPMRDKVKEMVNFDSAIYLNQNEEKNLPQVFVSMSERELRVLARSLALTWKLAERCFSEDLQRLETLDDSLDFNTRYQEHFTRLYQASTIYNRITALYGEQIQEDTYDW